MKTNIYTKGQQIVNLKKRTKKFSQSSTEMAAHTEILI
jgi:hypothetical protein